MKEALLNIVSSCPKPKNPIDSWLSDIESFCKEHGFGSEEFCNELARIVGIEFLQGELAYSDGDLVMNRLHAAMGDSFPFSQIAGDIYLAFDAGEFLMATDEPGSIPWVDRTLPMVKEALANDGQKKPNKANQSGTP